MPCRIITSATCLAFLASILLFTGCASQTGSSYTSGQTRKGNEVQMGTITHLNTAYIDNNPTGLGAFGGAVVGGVIGSTVGRGSGKILATLSGSIIGAVVGASIENALNNKDALEVTVILDNDATLVIVQELGDEEASFVVGERVSVLLGNGGSARVRR